MTGPLIHTWNLNLGYAKRLVADIPDDKMALQPAPGTNHAARGCPGFSVHARRSFVFVMAAHENIHLGQVSAWRRVQGMARV